MIKPLGKTFIFGLIFITVLFSIIYIFNFVFFPNAIFDTLNNLENYGLISLFSILVASLIAIYIYYSEKYSQYKKDKREQVKLVNGLLAELNIISSDSSETYFGCTKGNLEWYNEEIGNDVPKKLDHDINKLSFQEYITRLDSNICRNINFEKLVRSLSYLNDKIAEINHHTNRLKNMTNKNSQDYKVTKKWLLDTIKESKEGIKKITDDLINQRRIID